MRLAKPLLILIGLLVVEAIVVWRPFNSTAIGWHSGWDDKKTAGEMLGTFHLTQVIPATLLSAPTPKRHITHWWRSHRKLYSRPPNCFAIRFADYERENTGRIAVSYQQGEQSQHWLIDQRDLRSAYRRFCPDHGLQRDQPLRITIDGITGTSGQTATVWLSQSSPLPPAVINGRHAANRSLNLRLVRFEHIGPAEILGIDNGAYAFACLMSVLIGLGALLLTTTRAHART
jgi:hypothetical protein